MEGVEITEIANAIWEAPFVMIIKENKGGIIYANKVALELYEITWNDYINNSLYSKENDMIKK